MLSSYKDRHAYTKTNADAEHIVHGFLFSSDRSSHRDFCTSLFASASYGCSNNLLFSPVFCRNLWVGEGEGRYEPRFKSNVIIYFILEYKRERKKEHVWKKKSLIPIGSCVRQFVTCFTRAGSGFRSTIKRLFHRTFFVANLMNIIGLLPPTMCFSFVHPTVAGTRRCVGSLSAFQPSRTSFKMALREQKWHRIGGLFFVLNVYIYFTVYGI